MLKLPFWKYMNNPELIIENKYNPEKSRLVECPQCHKQIMSIELAPRCPIDSREMITIIKDIPIRVK